jgi:ribokinase
VSRTLAEGPPRPPSTEGHVLVLGSINRDLVVTVTRHPRPGETVHGHDLGDGPGGKGANQAVAAACAGATVRMVGAVGDDDAGRDLVALLQQEGIDVSGVARKADTPTGTALVVLAAGGENTIVVVPGANGGIDTGDVDDVELSADDVVVAQYETPAAPTAALLARARAVGAVAVLNPAPAGPVDHGLLALVDVLVVNEHELVTVTAMHSDATTLDADAIGAARAALVAQGFTGALVATLGSRGVVGVDGGGISQVPGHPVDAVDTTGAGDCFVGYLAAELTTGRDLPRALVTGNAAAALCACRAGAARAMPTRADVTAFLT